MPGYIVFMAKRGSRRLLKTEKARSGRAMRVGGRLKDFDDLS